MTDTAWAHQREVREALHAVVSDPQLGGLHESGELVVTPELRLTGGHSPSRLGGGTVAGR